MKMKDQIKCWLEYYHLQETQEVVEYFTKVGSFNKQWLQLYNNRPKALREAEVALWEKHLLEAKRRQEEYRNKTEDRAPCSLKPGLLSQLFGNKK